MKYLLFLLPLLLGFTFGVHPNNLTLEDRGTILLMNPNEYSLGYRIISDEILPSQSQGTIPARNVTTVRIQKGRAQGTFPLQVEFSHLESSVTGAAIIDVTIPQRFPWMSLSVGLLFTGIAILTYILFFKL